MVLLSH